MDAAAELRGCRPLVFRALDGPVSPDLPPRPGTLGGRLEPGVRVGAELAVDVVRRLRIARGIDQAGDVAGVAEHEGRRTADEFGRPVTALPRRQVISDRPGDECRDGDPAEVYRSAQNLDGACLAQGVVLEDVEELG